MKKRIFFIAFICTALFMTLICAAKEAEPLKISLKTEPEGELWQLCDGARYTKRAFSDGGRITISSDEIIEALYLVWDAPAPQSIKISSGGDEQLSQTGFIHDYISLESHTGEVTICFEGSAVLCDIYAFSGDETPDWVQRWQPNDDVCDILFLPTHADDEMLYFGGAMALAAERGSEMQVAYMVNHNGEYYRPHELLNGLWELGVRRYPVIPDFPDVYSWSLEHAKTIYDENDILAYQTDLILKYRPQIIIAHDLNGEYGHGAHILNAVSVTQAVEQAEKTENGWDTPKLYLHLYGENAITLDCSEPLSRFDGATAFEMAQRGFACHKSQQEFFKVEQSGPYDLRKFGLYRSTVGADSQNDIFENITLRRDMPAPEPEIIEAEIEPENAEPAESAPKSEPSSAYSQPQPEKKQFLPTAQNDRMLAFTGSVFSVVITALLAAVIAAVVYFKRR